MTDELLWTAFVKHNWGSLQEHRDLILCSVEFVLRSHAQKMDADAENVKIIPQHRGCICPPGADKTCQGFGCPRKPMTIT